MDDHLLALWDKPLVPQTGSHAFTHSRIQKHYGICFLGILDGCSSCKVMIGGNRRSTPVALSGGTHQRTGSTLRYFRRGTLGYL
ncbi:MAG: hypothetical protein V7L20_25840 [Nostoc sp.]